MFGFLARQEEGLMKTLTKILWIIAIGAIIAVVFIGCKGNKFIYEIPDFQSTPREQFSERDLGDVLAAIKNGEEIQKNYFSDVIFMEQSGSNFTFQAVGGNGTKSISIKDIPEGLTKKLSKGKKVRIYFYVSNTITPDRSGDFAIRNEGWALWAIEKL